MLAHNRRQPLVLELHGRQVHGHAHMIRPVRGFGTGGAQHPLADRDDQPGLLGESDEDVRQDVAACRAVPAHQRLEGGDAVVPEAIERLVVHLELTALHGDPQIRLQSATGVKAFIHAGIKECNGAALLLRPIQRDIGPFQQFDTRQPRFRQRDADAGADDDVAAQQFVRCGDRLHEPRTKCHRRGLIFGRAVHDDRKLVATKAGDHVAVAHTAAQAVRRPAAAIRRRQDGRACR